MDFTAPPVAFHFNVMFAGVSPPVPDTAFQAVDGLETGYEVEPLVEGGENAAQFMLPKPVRLQPVKLKRGLALATSGLVRWCKATLEGGLAQPIKPKTLVVSLLDADGLPVATWSLAEAYPLKWTIAGFDAMKNELAMETVELAHAGLTRKV